MIERQVSCLDGVFTEMRARLRRLTWLVGLKIAWDTVLIGAFVAIVLTYG